MNITYKYLAACPKRRLISRIYWKDKKEQENAVERILVDVPSIDVDLGVCRDDEGQPLE